ncbi:hypothetical protein LB503_007856 [Fusarium chuoi]|nr:hypothetical protein LB503_007856 [Fusarium chuoi]
MDRLAPEIVSNIIKHLVPDEYFSPAKFFDESRPPIHCLAPLAALCVFHISAGLITRFHSQMKNIPQRQRPRLTRVLCLFFGCSLKYLCKTSH